MSHKTFTQRRRLSWGEADPAGTIYAPRAIDLAIQAIEALWIDALGLSFREFQARHGLGAPWVHTSCEFSNPLRAGESFDLAIAIEKLGDVVAEMVRRSETPGWRAIIPPQTRVGIDRHEQRRIARNTGRCPCSAGALRGAPGPLTNS